MMEMCCYREIIKERKAKLLFPPEVDYFLTAHHEVSTPAIFQYIYGQNIECVILFRVTFNVMNAVCEKIYGNSYKQFTHQVIKKRSCY